MFYKSVWRNFGFYHAQKYNLWRPCTGARSVSGLTLDADVKVLCASRAAPKKQARPADPRQSFACQSDKTAGGARERKGAHESARERKGAHGSAWGSLRKKTRAGFSARSIPGLVKPGLIDLVQAFTNAVMASVMAAEAAKIERIAVIAFMHQLPGAIGNAVKHFHVGFFFG